VNGDAMKVIEFSPHGFCKGVVNALNIINKVIEDPFIPRPIYLLGSLVHNKQINQAIESKGVIVLDGKSRDDMLDEIAYGTVVLTAHGVSPFIYEKVAKKGLFMIDSTCKDVMRSHKIIREKINDGFTVLYIGKLGHPETEGVLGIHPEIVLIETLDDITNLAIKNKKLAVTNQTTMSMYDIYTMFEKLKELFPHIELIDELCYATKQRQQAVIEQSKLCNAVIVVGDKSSNNCKKLAEIARSVAKKDVYQIQSIEELDLDSIRKYSIIGITSAASTPYAITKEIIDVLERLDEIHTPTVKSSLQLQDYLVIKKHRL
jgi:4-hydroxy-3-methylbut-2-enyl diphosphate reductase